MAHEEVEYKRSFEELHILQKRGLLPQESQEDEPLPMAETKRANLENGIVAFLRDFGYVETLEINNMRTKLVEFVAGRSVEQLIENGKLQEFGIVIGEYLDVVQSTLTQERVTNSMVIILMTILVHLKLRWDEELIEQLDEATNFISNAELDDPRLFELFDLGYDLTI